jgi:hypothetical protein
VTIYSNGAINFSNGPVFKKSIDKKLSIIYTEISYKEKKVGKQSIKNIRSSNGKIDVAGST